MKYAKQNKYEYVEDYYDKFLQLCVVIPQQPHDMYLRKAFGEGLKPKVKMAIISMSQSFLAKVEELAIMIKEEMPIKT